MTTTEVIRFPLFEQREGLGELRLTGSILCRAESQIGSDGPAEEAVEAKTEP